jgi:sterile alpha motif and leucine zipper-containing kinase AZK
VRQFSLPPSTSVPVLQAELTGHADAVRAIAVPSGTSLLNAPPSLVTASDDRYVVRWGPSRDSVPDNQLLMPTSEAGKAHRFTLTPFAPGEVIGSDELRAKFGPRIMYAGFSAPIRCVTWVKNQVYFGDGPLIRIYSLDFGVVSGELTGHTGTVTDLVNDGKDVVMSCGADMQIILWRNDKLALRIGGFTSPVHTLAYGADTLIASCTSSSGEHTTQVWTVSKVLADAPAEGAANNTVGGSQYERLPSSEWKSRVLYEARITQDLPGTPDGKSLRAAAGTVVGVIVDDLGDGQVLAVVTATGVQGRVPSASIDLSHKASGSGATLRADGRPDLCSRCGARPSSVRVRGARFEWVCQLCSAAVYGELWRSAKSDKMLGDVISGPMKLLVENAGVFGRKSKWQAVWVEVDTKVLRLFRDRGKKRDKPSEVYPLFQSVATVSPAAPLQFTFMAGLPDSQPMQFEVDLDDKGTSHRVTESADDWVSSLNDMACRLQDRMFRTLLELGKGSVGSFLSTEQIELLVNGCLGTADLIAEDSELRRILLAPLEGADATTKPVTCEQQVKKLVEFQEQCCSQILAGLYSGISGATEFGIKLTSPKHGLVDFGGKRHALDVVATASVSIKNLSAVPLQVGAAVVVRPRAPVAVTVTTNPEGKTVPLGATAAAMRLSVGTGMLDAEVRSLTDDAKREKLPEVSLDAGAEGSFGLSAKLDCTKVHKDVLTMTLGNSTAFLYVPLLVESEGSKYVAFDEIEFADQLGRGRFGTVWKAKYRKHRVAIKVIPLKEDFEQEVGILSRLASHPNLVKSLGFCSRIPFQGFILLELAVMGSLDTLIYDPKVELTPHLTLRIALDMAEALAFLHSHKIFHLDLKPQNALVFDQSPVPTGVVAKLCDFGISRQLESTETFKGDQVEGTVLYIPPEMLGSKTFTQKTDIYSYGVVMWELCLRQQPYSEGKFATMSRWDFENAKIEGALPGTMPPASHPLREILEASLQLDHKKRPTAVDITSKLKTINVAQLPQQVALSEESVRIRTQRMQRTNNAAVAASRRGPRESAAGGAASSPAGAASSNKHVAAANLYKVPAATAAKIPRPPTAAAAAVPRPKSSSTYDSVNSALAARASAGGGTGGAVPVRPRPAPIPGVGDSSSIYESVTTPLQQQQQQQASAAAAQRGYDSVQSTLEQARMSGGAPRASSQYDVVRQPTNQYVRPAPPPSLSGPRIPQRSDYEGRPWWREMRRPEAEQWLMAGKPVGTFIIRPSSQEGCLSISHVEKDGTIGHGMIHMHKGANGRFGWSIENSRRTYATLDDLLAVLPGLRL